MVECVLCPHCGWGFLDLQPPESRYCPQCETAIDPAGTIVALDYSDPAEGAPAWFVQTTDVAAARQRVREHVAARTDRAAAAISTVVCGERVPPQDGLPTLAEGEARVADR